MKPTIPIIAALLLLSACETNQQDADAIKAQATKDADVLQGRAEQSGMRIANTLRDNIKITSMKMREWYLTPLPDPQPKPVPPSYCYQVFQDIVCYRDPMPGMTHKLVGYQGDGTQPPPVAQTTVLPASRIRKEANNFTGEARVTNAKPVFVKAPPQIKEAKPNTGEVTAGSEPLPDPSLSPQL